MTEDKFKIKVNLRGFWDWRYYVSNESGQDIAWGSAATKKWAYRCAHWKIRNYLRRQAERHTTVISVKRDD